MITDILNRERELLDRLSFALLKGRDVEPCRKALLEFYRFIGL